MADNEAEKSPLLGLADLPFLLGRTFLVYELRPTDKNKEDSPDQPRILQGPIQSIGIIEQNRLKITLEWIAESKSGSQRGPWQLCEDHEKVFVFRDDEAYARKTRNLDDDTIEVVYPKQWRGSIRSPFHSLPKPPAPK